MAPALSKSDRHRSSKQKQVKLNVEDMVLESELPPLSPWTDAEAPSLFHDIDRISDDNILNVKIHTSPTRKEARQIARCVSDYYLHLLESQDVNPRNLLSGLAHIAKLMKPLLYQGKTGQCIFEEAITSDQEHELTKLRQEIEEEYTPLITDALSLQADGLLKLKPPSYDMAMHNSFAQFAGDINIARGATHGNDSDIDVRRWARLIPNLLGSRIDLVIRRLDNIHSEMQRFVYLELGNETTKLWYLIWKNLKTIWLLFKDHDSCFESADYALESRFYRTEPIQNLFGRVETLPEFLNIELVKNIVGCYCAFISHHRHCRGVRSEQLRGWDPEQPISHEASSELIKQLSSFTWEPRARPALQWAVIRFNHLTGGPTVARQDHDSAKSWVVGVDEDYASVVEELISGERDRDSTESSYYLSAGPPNSNATTRSLGPIEYPTPYGRNMTVAYDYVYFPFPENRAQEVAESRRISRDLRDPGIISEGPRIEDCINLPPPHVRPPGTYTGHKHRRWVGPYDFLKLFGEELIRWLAWQPYPTRKLPKVPPSITTRASCRQRKIEKELKRQSKLQNKKRTGFCTAAKGPLHDPRTRVGKAGRTNSTTPPPLLQSKISTMPKLRGGGFKGPDSGVRNSRARTGAISKLHLGPKDTVNDVNAEVNKPAVQIEPQSRGLDASTSRTRQRAPGSPTPLPRPMVRPSNAHGSMGSVDTDAISALPSIDADADGEASDIREDDASPERRQPSNQENNRPGSDAAQVPGARNPLQELTLVEVPADATAKSSRDHISISSSESSHHASELIAVDCHPCPSIEGQWHHMCHHGDCPGARDFTHWLRREVGQGRAGRPWQRMRQEGFGTYFARAHTADQPQNLGQVNNTAGNAVNNTDNLTGGGRNNQAPDNPYAAGSGPRGIFLGVLINSIRYSTMRDAEHALKDLSSRGVTQLGESIIDQKTPDNVVDAVDDLYDLKATLFHWGMSFLPDAYYEDKYLPKSPQRSESHLEDDAPPEAPHNNRDQQTQTQIKHEEGQPALFHGVIINDHQYLDQDLAEEEFLALEANPDAFRHAYINGRAYENLADAFKAFEELQELLRRAERIQLLPRRSALQQPEGGARVQEAPAQVAYNHEQLAFHYEPDPNIAALVQRQYGHPVPPAYQPVGRHHVRDYAAEDIIGGQPNNNIGLDQLLMWQNGLAADEAGPEYIQPQQPRTSNRRPDRIAPDEQQLQSEQQGAVERGLQLDTRPDVEVVAEEVSEVQSEPSVGQRRDRTTPIASPPQKIDNKGKKPQKAGKRRDAEIIDLTRDTGEVSPQDINRRTRAQRRMVEIEQEEEDTTDQQDQDDQGKGKEKDKKKGKGKGPKNTAPTQDKPNNDDDDDDSDNNNPDGAGPAKEPRRTTRATAASKAKTTKTGKPQTATTQKTGKGKAGTKAGKKRSHAETIDNNNQNKNNEEQLHNTPVIPNYHPSKKPRTINPTRSKADTDIPQKNPPTTMTTTKSPTLFLLPNPKVRMLRAKPLTNYNPKHSARMRRKVSELEL